MKKVILITMLSVLLLGLIACSDQKRSEEKQTLNTTTEVSKDKIEKTNRKNTNKDVREKVWEQLSLSQKEEIRGTWKDAKIQKITLKPGMGKIDKGEYIGKEVYIIDFPKNQSINNLLVYADLSNNEIIGYGYMD